MTRAQGPPQPRVPCLFTNWAQDYLQSYANLQFPEPGKKLLRRLFMGCRR